MVAIRPRPDDVLVAQAVTLHHVERPQAVLVVASTSERGLHLHVETAACLTRTAKELTAS